MHYYFTYGIQMLFIIANIWLLEFLYTIHLLDMYIYCIYICLFAYARADNRTLNCIDYTFQGNGK